MSTHECVLEHVLGIFRRTNSGQRDAQRNFALVAFDERRERVVIALLRRHVRVSRSEDVSVESRTTIVVHFDVTEGSCGHGLGYSPPSIARAMLTTFWLGCWFSTCWRNALSTPNG